ncbi:hypothetical protein [Spiroplasma endosymbiont of Stenodema calcarata]|uniref:hypothetical protein n=1 Tax=Spiroplasma endosymbiont of Stenodema calcarata TaxID=3139328 RepID=UPI003CCB5FE3
MDLKEKYLKLEYIKNIYLSKIVIWICFFISFDFVFLITQKIMLLTNNTFLFKIIWIKIFTIYIGDNLIYPIYLITILFFIFKYRIKKNIEKIE